MIGYNNSGPNKQLARIFFEAPAQTFGQILAISGKLNLRLLICNWVVDH